MTPSDLIGLTSATMQSFKFLGDLVKSLSNIRDSVRVNDAVLEIQQKLLEQQTSKIDIINRYYAVSVEKDALKAEILAVKEQLAQARQFKANAKRYKLITVCPGFDVYALKETDANGEPPHWLCPQCLDNGVKGFVQASSPDGFPIDEPGDLLLQCMRCGKGTTLSRAAFDAAWRYA